MGLVSGRKKSILRFENSCFGIFRPQIWNLKRKIGVLKKNCLFPLWFDRFWTFRVKYVKIFKIGEIKAEIGIFFSKHLIFAQDSNFEVKKFQNSYFRTAKSIFSTWNQLHHDFVTFWGVKGRVSILQKQSIYELRDILMEILNTCDKFQMIRM